MRLYEALKILQTAPAAPAELLRVFLVSSFTPLHLQTFLAARLQMAMPARRIHIDTGLYGDLLGNLQRMKQAPVDARVIMLEWADLDPRLGLRALGGWYETDPAEILAAVQKRLARIRDIIQTSAEVPVVICLPALPLPPFQATVTTGRASTFDIELQQHLGSFALSLSTLQTVSIVSSRWLDRISPPGERLDVKSELLDGFPYSLAYVSAVSELLVNLIYPPSPKKGLITDLDGTLWKGIVGEVGPRHVSWDLDQKSHIHALYQALLRSFCDTGVLIAVASKNDPALVDEAFARPDMILKREACFPLEVHWGPKSESVSRILRAWNIGPESVVFVDDNPVELAEVQTAHPGLEYLRFPASPGEGYELLARLRNLFAKREVTAEDRLRAASIRNQPYLRDATAGSSAPSDEFLEQAEPVLRLSWNKSAGDVRVLELLNKTNQFNLNGKRYTEATLCRHLTDPLSFLLTASYADKFGPLGRIAVILGRSSGNMLRVDALVMSCRAFSRRIEHACLAELFKKFHVDELELDFVATERNKPLQEFLTQFLSNAPEPGCRISNELFETNCPQLFHRVEEEAHG